MSGILQINRGVVDVNLLQDGEFYLNKSKSYIQIGSGSSILTLLPLNQYVSGDIILNGNIYANNLTGSGQIGETIITTATLGGISAGTAISGTTKFDDIFKQLFRPYVPPIINSLSLKFGTTDVPTTITPIGETITFNRLVISSSVDSSGSVMSNPTLNINGSHNSDTTISVTGLTNLLQTITISNIDFTKRSVGNVIFTLNASNTNIIPVTLNYYFNFPTYLVATDAVIGNNTDAQTAIDNYTVDYSVNTGSYWELNCDSNNNNPLYYTYIIYPATNSDLTSIEQQSTSVIGAFSKVGTTFNITSNGVTTAYKIYQSNAPGAFSNGTKLKVII